MNRTRIEWCDMTWNPVTGCQHGCLYCYAEKIAKRFGKPGDGTIHDLKSPELVTSTKEISAAMEPLEVYAEYRVCPYPYGFAPTFHRYKLEGPQKAKKAQNIFVCSMADLFGSWVPDEWIKKVFDHCYLAPQHTYMFLTKNPERYYDVIEYLENGVKNYTTPPCIYLGATATNTDQLWAAYKSPAAWISLEPLHEEIYEDTFVDFLPPDSSEVARWLWVVLGAETGNRKGKIIPKRGWIEEIVECCRFWKTPVFMKNSLADIWGEPLIQEYPWELPENSGSEA